MSSRGSSGSIENASSRPIDERCRLLEECTRIHVKTRRGARKLENVVSWWAQAGEDSSSASRGRIARRPSEPKQVEDLRRDTTKSAARSYRTAIDDGGRHVARTRLVGPARVSARLELRCVPVIASLSSTFPRDRGRGGEGKVLEECQA